MVEYIIGDLFTNVKDGEVAIHNCNCFCTWGAGFARQARVRWPNAHAADLATLRGDVKKMGTFTTALDNGHYVANVYGQYIWSRSKPAIRVKDLERALRGVVAMYGDVTYRLPFIGAGLAMGDIDDIRAMLTRVFDGKQAYVYLLKRI